MTEGQTDQSEQVADLAAPRSAGVEAAYLREIMHRYDFLTVRAAELAEGQTDQVFRDRDNAEAEMWAAARRHLNNALKSLEQPVPPDEGREVADAG